MRPSPALVADLRPWPTAEGLLLSKVPGRALAPRFSLLVNWSGAGAEPRILERPGSSAVRPIVENPLYKAEEQGRDRSTPRSTAYKLLPARTEGGPR